MFYFKGINLSVCFSEVASQPENTETSLRKRLSSAGRKYTVELSFSHNETSVRLVVMPNPMHIYLIPDAYVQRILKD